MTAQDTAGRGIADLDARAVEATVSLVKQAGGEARKRDGAAFAPGVAVPAQTGLLDQIVATLGRRPSWPR